MSQTYKEPVRSLQLEPLTDEKLRQELATSVARQALGLIRSSDLLYKCRQCSDFIIWTTKHDAARLRMCTQCGFAKSSQLIILREWDFQ